MTECCLLGICCPPSERRQKMIARYVAKGVVPAVAETLADDDIAQIERFLATPIGALVKGLVAFAHAGRHQ